MASSDINATIEFRAGLQGGSDPWTRASALRVDASGFQDPEGIGRGGDDPEILNAAQAAELLLATFSREDLRALLDQFVQLRRALGD